jgi:hypothetical protein
MTAQLIEFSLVHGDENAIPRPYPANREMPEWFKSMPADAETQSDYRLRTVKNCPPFVEAMTCGYIIPLSADISLSVDPAGQFVGKGPTWIRGTEAAEMVQSHRKIQLIGSPYEKSPVVKILNPWLIRTPPGYSTLFLSMLNRYLIPLVPLAGLVETDIFYRNVNFPCLLTIPLGTTLTLTKGVPLVQAIPIKREDFQAQFVPVDMERLMAVEKENAPGNPNYYRDNFWKKKSYH